MKPIRDNTLLDKKVALIRLIDSSLSHVSFAMRDLVFFLAAFQLVYSSCPDGYELVRDGECRGFSAKVSTTYEESLNQAVSKCSEVQGKPVIIHNEEQHNYWMKKREAWTSAYLILGLTCNATGKAEWADGSPVDYIPPEGGVDDLNYCYSDCSWYLWHDGHFHSLCSPIDVSTDVFCTTQLQQPTPSGDGCDGFEDDNEDAACYQVSKTAESWQDAQRVCKTFGADLASIHNGKENTFIRRLATSKGALTGVFLGGTTADTDNGFRWIDGSTWDYDNFANGFPIPGQGDCLAMDTSTSAGNWMNTDCSRQLPAACVRQSKNHTCTSGPWSEGQYITSPGFPFEASIPCDFLFTVASGKRVEVEVIFLEANSCCDQLVIYDDFTGGNLIANITGEVSNKVYKTKGSNKMRVSWNPSGGVNVKGVMMTYRAV